MIGVATGFRFGVGFALAVLLVGVLVWILSLLILNLTDGLTLGQPEASTFSGTGTQRSQVIELKGQVEVSWIADTQTPEACRHRGAIYRAGRPNDREVIVDQEVSASANGTQILSGLAEAQYILDVESTCTWSFRLSH